MVPSARLIVYYIVMAEETAELVADSVWLNVEQKCGNSLDVSSKIGAKICECAFILWSDFNLGLHKFFNTSLKCLPSDGFILEQCAFKITDTDFQFID